MYRKRDSHKQRLAAETLEPRVLLAVDAFAFSDAASTFVSSTSNFDSLFVFGSHGSGYAKFDADSIDHDFDFATLAVTPSYISGSSADLVLSETADWDPSALSWNNSPAIHDEIHSWTSTLNETVFVDVSDEIRDAISFGDLNEDGNYTRSDVEAFDIAVKNPNVLPLNSREVQVRADTNRDGLIDTNDAEGFLAVHGSLLGDINLDGEVNFSDHLIVSRHFGQSGRSYLQGDVNFDSQVNSLDSDIIRDRFGTASDTTPSQIRFQFSNTNGQFVRFDSTDSVQLLVTKLGANEIDQDGDGIADSDERNVFGTSTDPINGFDTDGDVLSDFVELTTNGLDHLVSEDDPTTVRNEATEGDLDADGLINVDEVIHGTDLDSSDSDGDGTSDSEEIDQRSDPTDADDEGEAPAPEDLVKVNLYVGDPRGSTSEHYHLHVGDIQHQAPRAGGQASQVYDFEKGKSYDIELFHRGSNRTNPDYDWWARATLPEGETSMIIREDNFDVNSLLDDFNHNPGILGDYKWNGTGEAGDTFGADSKKAHLHIPKVQLELGEPMANGLHKLTVHEIKPQRLVDNGRGGIFFLKFDEGLRIWKDEAKTEPVTSQGQIELSGTELFVEQLVAPSSPKEIKLTYSPGIHGHDWTWDGEAVDSLHVCVHHDPDADLPTIPIRGRVTIPGNDIASNGDVSLRVGRDAINAELQKEHDEHDETFYFNVTGYHNLIAQMGRDVSDVRSFKVEDLDVEGLYRWGSREMVFDGTTSGATLSSGTLIHEMVHVTDRKNGWYLRGLFGSQQPAERLAYATEALREELSGLLAVDRALKNGDVDRVLLLWRENVVNIGQRVFGKEASWVSGFKVDSDFVNATDVQDVGAKLGFTINLTQIAEQINKELAKCHPDKRVEVPESVPDVFK